MRIYGIDFTSAPRKAKPIVCCSATLTSRAKSRLPKLQIDAINCWTDFRPFENFLHSRGPWFAGLDLPFGQPKQLVNDLGWPRSWSEYVRCVGDLSRDEFVELIEAYSKSKPAGKKHLFRETDRIASACSPMMIYGVPVAKMFYEAAPRLLRSSVSISPCRKTKDDRVVVETYPALLARSLIGRRSYKASSRSKDTTERRTARRDLLTLLDGAVKQNFGIRLSFSSALEKSCERDCSGDRLDSVFCCVQAAWAFTRPGNAIPSNVDANEGWIVHSFDDGSTTHSGKNNV